MNPNINQAIQEEELGIGEEIEDIDYDAIYGGLDVEYDPEEELSVSDYAKDFASQAGKEFLIGAGGAWGDLAQLAGINPYQTEGSKARTKTDFEILEKMEQPGYEPSFSDIYALSSDDDIAPNVLGLNTSESLRNVNELIGGPGEPKTIAGRFGGRVANRVGSSVSFGGVGAVPAAVSGVVGQTAEELGADPLTQGVLEIGSLLLTPSGAKKNLGDLAKKEVKDKINNLRKLGYSDEEITLALNSSSKGKVLGLKASKGKNTEQAFKNFSSKSDELINDILNTKIKGFEEGIDHVKKLANDSYGDVVKKYGSMKINDLSSFNDSMKNVLSNVKRVIGNNAEGNKFIKELSKDIKDINKNPNVEDMIYFYQRLNNMGNWVKGDKKNQLINQSKEVIKNTFKKDGSKGKELANDFDTVNKGIQKAYQTADIRKIMDKSITPKGLDYNKLNKSLDKPENFKLFEQVIGKEEASNLRKISRLGKEVGDFDKSWKNVKNLGTTSVLGSAAYYLYSHDIPGVAAFLGSKAAVSGARKLNELILTNPKFQNLMIKGLNSIKNKSLQSLKTTNELMEKLLKEEGVDLNLD